MKPGVRVGSLERDTFMWATGVSVAVAGIFFVLSTEGRHWFVIPVAASGALIGWEAVAWGRGSRRLFDSDVAVSIIGLHFFLVAPLLHVFLNEYMAYVVPPPDWRPWLGRMASINVVGLAAYRVGRSLSFRASPKRFEGPLWDMDPRHLGPLLGMLALSIMLQGWIYSYFGGLGGYVSTFEGAGVSGGFEGFGVVFALSESAPMLIVMAILSGRGARLLRRGWLPIGIFVLLAFCIKLLFGGLRGSRGEVVWYLYWCLAVIDYRVRPIRKGVLMGCAIFGMLFMYSYGFYKAAGVAGVRSLLDSDQWKGRESSRKRTLASVLLGDLARADVQAYLLYRCDEVADSCGSAMGATYVAAILAHVPLVLRLPRPPGKLEVGTEVQYGPGSYDRNGFHSTAIYGLSGETLLNFGPLWIPAAYFLFGAIISAARRLESAVPPSDARAFLRPLLGYAAVLMLTADMDNVIYVAAKVAVVPVVAVALCSRRGGFSQRQALVEIPSGLRRAS